MQRARDPATQKVVTQSRPRVVGHDCLYRCDYLFERPMVDFCRKPTQTFHWHSSPFPTDNLKVYLVPTLEVRRVECFGCGLWCVGEHQRTTPGVFNFLVETWVYGLSIKLREELAQSKEMNSDLVPSKSLPKQ